MAKQTIERTDYHNASAETIVFEQGTSPNDYAEKITVLPGETYKGYVNYAPFYKRNGLSTGPSPTAGKLREEAASASAEAATMKAEAEEAKLEALEAKREAEAMKAEAQVAMAEAANAKAQAALTEQVDEEEVDENDPLAPVMTAKQKKAAAKAAAKAK